MAELNKYDILYGFTLTPDYYDSTEIKKIWSDYYDFIDEISLAMKRQEKKQKIMNTLFNFGILAGYSLILYGIWGLGHG